LNTEHPGRKSGSSCVAPVILLTGRPGIGKTTAIRHIVAALVACTQLRWGRLHPAPQEEGAGGFYTREVRAGGRRTGFELVTLAGETALLATKDPDETFDRPVPFGRYRVNLDAIDAVGVPALLDALDQGQVVVVDEIGPMEILSPRFRDGILRILASENSEDALSWNLFRSLERVGRLDALTRPLGLDDDFQVLYWHRSWNVADPLPEIQQALSRVEPWRKVGGRFQTETDVILKGQRYMVMVEAQRRS
jgi:nucleoside-triphosphatase THEP1